MCLWSSTSIFNLEIDYFSIYHYLMRQHLNQSFGERWTGRESAVEWPPWSPDLNPLDLFCENTLKTLVYSSPINNVPDIRQRTENAPCIIRGTKGIFENVRRSMILRREMCVAMEGGHIEH